MAKKEPKEKKTKEKKPPKEKKPKEKKPKEKKPPKPKKEKAPKKKKADGDKGGKKGGKKTLLLIIIIGVVAAAAAVAAIFTLRSIGGGDEPQTLEESEDGEDGESKGEEGEDGELEGEEGEEGEESGDAEAETPAPTSAPDPLRVITAMTTAETEEYLRRFTPASLGLPGQSMDDYEIYAADNVVLVDGYTCAELSVYSKDSSAGTNDIEGWFLLSRSSDHKLFALDRETGELTELNPERNTDSN